MTSGAVALRLGRIFAKSPALFCQELKVTYYDFDSHHMPAEQWLPRTIMMQTGMVRNGSCITLQMSGGCYWTILLEKSWNYRSFDLEDKMVDVFFYFVSSTASMCFL